MAKFHEVQCDVCKKREHMKWNSEYWLLPEGWLELSENTYSKGEICPDCNPMKPKPQKQKAK